MELFEDVSTFSQVFTTKSGFKVELVNVIKTADDFRNACLTVLIAAGVEVAEAEEILRGVKG